MFDEGINALSEKIDKVGMSEAFDMLNALVEEQFTNDLKIHLKILQKGESSNLSEKNAAITAIDFLTKLQNSRKCKNQAVELATCLVHPSLDLDIANVYSRAKIDARITKIPNMLHGRNAIYVIIIEHFLKKNYQIRYTAQGLNSLVAFFGNPYLRSNYWTKSKFGMPFVGNSLSIDNESEIKRIPSMCYDKLVDAIITYEGWEAARIFVIESLKVDQYASKFNLQIFMGDAKSLVQEYFQATGGTPPKYNVERIAESLDHKPEFKCEISYDRFGTIRSKSDTKTSATKKVAEKLVIAILKNLSSKSKMNNLIGKKLDQAKHHSFIKPIKDIPPNFYQFNEKIELFFGIKPKRHFLFEALTSQNQATKNKLPSHASLTILGAFLIQYFDSLEKGSSGNSQKSVPLFCAEIADKLSLHEYSSKLLYPSGERTQRIDEALCKSVIGALFLSNKNNFMEKFSIFYHDWYAKKNLSKKRINIFEELDLSKYDEHFTYIQALQVYVQSLGSVTPTFTKYKTGPDHLPLLHVTCKYQNYTSQSTGKNSKQAREKACYEMLKLLINDKKI